MNFDIQKIARVILFMVIFMAIGYFVYLNTRDFRKGPILIVLSPEDGALSDEMLIELTGQSFNTSFISVNGRPIFIDENGNFVENYLLNYGNNVIIFEAIDKFERKVSKKINIVYNGDRSEYDAIIKSYNFPDSNDARGDTGGDAGDSSDDEGDNESEDNTADTFTLPRQNEGASENASNNVFMIEINP